MMTKFKIIIKIIIRLSPGCDDHAGQPRHPRRCDSGREDKTSEGPEPCEDYHDDKDGDADDDDDDDDDDNDDDDISDSAKMMMIFQTRRGSRTLYLWTRQLRAVGFLPN